MTSELTLSELYIAIRRLKMKKAPGKGGVTDEMIKHLGPLAMKKLLELYNSFWKSGVFPTAWKEAIIIPILKKAKDKKNKSSYRPISLLSCLGKTPERIINKRLRWHLEANNLIHKEQTGFRTNRNTEDQLVHLAQSIENAFMDKIKVIVVFVDLSKAFDKVWKIGFLLKLMNLGVAGNMYRWIESFLLHRTAKVKLDGSLSQTVMIRKGVPQGGVIYISPTLFVVFINDITENISRHISRAFHADDYAVWNAADALSHATVRMQEALNITSKWATDWCVNINSSTTVATCLSLQTQKSSSS